MKSIVKLLPLIVILLASTNLHLSAQSETKKEKGIDFEHGTWEEILEKATTENKPIFIDAFTTWCGPCKMMARSVFTDQSVGDFYNQFYINYKLDMETTEGKKFAKTYNVRSYPTLLYVKSNGDVLHRAVGARQPRQFITEGRKGLIDKEKIEEYTILYNSGYDKPDMLREYINLLWLAENDKYSEVSKKYFSSLSQKELLNKENTSLIFNTTSKMTDAGYQIILDNRAHFEDRYGDTKVAEQLTRVATSTLPVVIQNKDAKQMDKIAQALKLANKDKTTGNSFADMAYLYFYEGTKDWKKYAKKASKYLKNNDVENPNVLNSIAWNFYENIDNKSCLKEALGWAQKSVEIESSYANNDTVAALLYKLGRYIEAKEAAENAIAIAKKSKQRYNETETLLKKINNKL